MLWYLWQGDKNIIKFEGDHNSPRPQFYFDSISIFFNNVLQPPEDDAPVRLFDPVHEYIDKVDCRLMPTSGEFDEKEIVVVNNWFVLSIFRLLGMHCMV